MALPIKISLPEHFLEDEVRCGYEVTGKLKKIWAVQLDLVSELKRVCDKYGLKFMLAYGTLIGAVRHKGFIPWDDDFDVWIRRADFEKLLAISDREFSYPYFLQHAMSDRKFFFPYARLRNSETTGIISKQGTPEYNNGIYVDVYVVDGYTDSNFLYGLQTIIRDFTLKLITLAFEGHKCRSLFERFCICFAKAIATVLSFERRYRLYRWTLSLFNKSASRVGPRYRIHPKAKSWWIESEVFNDLIDLPYENLQLPCPRNADAHLARMYGEYMKFPPASERGKWHEGQIHYDPDTPYKEYLKNASGVKRV